MHIPTSIMTLLINYDEITMFLF